MNKVKNDYKQFFLRHMELKSTLSEIHEELTSLQSRYDHIHKEFNMFQNKLGSFDEGHSESSCVSCGKSVTEAEHCISGGQYLYDDDGEWVCSDECFVKFEKKGIKMTASHSPKGTESEGGNFLILTEEELAQLENFAVSADGLSETNSYKVINSHRLLLSANAELSFKNARIQTECKTVNDDYKALVDIIDRARKLAFLSEEPK